MHCPVLHWIVWCTRRQGRLGASKRSSNVSYAPWGYKRTPYAPWRSTQASQEHTTTPRLRSHAFDLLMRDLSAFLSCDSIVLICVLSSLLVCVVLLQLCSCVCFDSLLTLDLIVINCVRHERLQFVEISHNWDIDIRKTTMTLKFDLWITWEWLSANLDQRRSSQHGVGIGRTTVKNVVSLINFTYFYYYIIEFSYSLVILLLSLILILKEQSSEEFSFLLSSHHNLILVLTNTFYKPSLCCLELVLQGHLFTPSRCSHLLPNEVAKKCVGSDLGPNTRDIPLGDALLKASRPLVGFSD
jgi:hypothetical protein